MSTKTDSLQAPRDDALNRQVDAAVDILRGGGVVCIPTDTLYGLAAAALDERAVERLFEIKGRPRTQPLPLLLADAGDMARFASEVPDIAWRLAEQFFPGALTLVLPKAAGVSGVVSGGRQTVALRVPDHWVPRAIARGLGAPITGTSANRTGESGPTTAEMVRTALGDEVDLIVDGGPSPVGVASTVLDLSGDTPVITRQGAVHQREIEEVCGCRVAVRPSKADQATSAPMTSDRPQR